MRTKLTFIPYKRVNRRRRRRRHTLVRMVGGSCMTDLRKWFFFSFSLSYTMEKGSENKILFTSLCHITILTFAMISTWKIFLILFQSFMLRISLFCSVSYFSARIKLIQICSQMPLCSQEELNLKMTGSCSGLSDPLRMLSKLTVRS